MFVKWRGTEDVCGLSTGYGATGEDRVELKKKLNGKFETINILIPPLLKRYNAGMGGVDLSDQLVQSYQVLRRTRKWWKALFFHILDIAATNAYIIHSQISPGVTIKIFYVHR